MTLLRPRRPAKAVRLRARTVLDSDGDPVESWDDPLREPLKRATVDSVTSTEEDGVVRRLIEAERLLFLPHAADLTRFDRVELGDEVWRVHGDPVVRTALSSGTYTKAHLTRVAG